MDLLIKKVEEKANMWKFSIIGMCDDDNDVYLIYTHPYVPVYACSK